MYYGIYLNNLDGNPLTPSTIDTLYETDMEI